MGPGLLPAQWRRASAMGPGFRSGGDCARNNEYGKHARSLRFQLYQRFTTGHLPISFSVRSTLCQKARPIGGRTTAIDQGRCPARETDR
jgi:hypothetical protein